MYDGPEDAVPDMAFWFVVGFIITVVVSTAFGLSTFYGLQLIGYL